MVRTLTPYALRSLKEDDALPYRHPAVRALVWELKYRANPQALALAGALIGDELMITLEEELGGVLLIPVPMHEKRKRERGYNQCELLCEAALAACREGGVAHALLYAPRVLSRIHPGVPQQLLPRRLRLTNVKGSMEVREPKSVRGRICVVVDDVATTGATFKEARRALKEAGAKRVHTVALARS